MIYIVEAFFVAAVPFFTRNHSERAKKRCCIVIFISMFLLMALRSKSLGMYDMEIVYIPMLHNVKNLSFSEIPSVYPFARGNLLQYLTKIFTIIFSDNENLFIVLTSIPCLACFARFNMKYGLDKYTCAFSFFLFMGLRMYGANFYLVRHSFAMAMLLLSIDGIIEKKPLKFLILTLLAGWFHTSALIFLVVYPFARIRPSWKQILVGVGGVVFVVYMGQDFISYLFSVLGSENYYYNFSSKGGFTSNTFIPITIMLFITAFGLCKKNNITLNKGETGSSIQGNERYRWLIKNGITDSTNVDICCVSLNMLFFAALFMGLSLFVSEFQRISFFFLITSLTGFSNMLGFENNYGIRRGLFIFFFILLIIFMNNALAPEMLSPYESWLL